MSGVPKERDIPRHEKKNLNPVRGCMLILKTTGNPYGVSLFSSNLLLTGNSSGVTLLRYEAPVRPDG
jgi:hypothetical protein